MFWEPTFTVVFFCAFTDHLNYRLDYMRLLSPDGGPTHASIVSYTLHWLLDWGRPLTQTVFKFTIPWRAQAERPVNVVQRGFVYFRVCL